jgi:hypothetical protein
VGGVVLVHLERHPPRHVPGEREVERVDALGLEELGQLVHPRDQRVADDAVDRHLPRELAGALALQQRLHAAHHPPERVLAAQRVVLLLEAVDADQRHQVADLDQAVDLLLDGDAVGAHHGAALVRGEQVGQRVPVAVDQRLAPPQEHLCAGLPRLLQ